MPILTFNQEVAPLKHCIATTVMPTVNQQVHGVDSFGEGLHLMQPAGVILL